MGVAVVLEDAAAVIEDNPVVDRIEEDLAEVAPETRHVDLEPD